MPYTPTTTFSAGTVLESAEFQGNQDELKIYLHEGVQTADLDASQWVENRFLQPPRIDPVRGLQHGISGWQGGQTTDGPGVRLSFASSFYTGGGKSGVVPDEWAPVPNASFTLRLRRQAKVLLHWSVEIANGPDDLSTTSGYNYAEDDRYIWVAPYVGNLDTVQLFRGQEVRNGLAFKASAPYGTRRPYVLGGYGQREGVCLYPGTEASYASVGAVTVGIGYYCRSDRAVIARWSVAIEAWYV
jgi:hypothetical protein